MTPFDRSVRATIYALLADGEERVDVGLVAQRGGWEEADVLSSFRRLADEHRVALVEDGHRIWMAHPFSGVPTPYRAVTRDRSWFANCAWDALAILSMLGDGDAMGERGLVWRVRQGVVAPNGLVRLVVPARNFWDDIGFTWSNIGGFRSEAHLAEWLAESGEDRGEVVAAQTMFNLSRDWYRGRLDVEWSPPTAAEAEAMFAKHGLTGDFWALSPHAG